VSARVIVGVVMGLHKITAGHGYTYLTRQVAAMDATHRGRASLADYYSAKGEAPGYWMGSGLASLGAPLGRIDTAKVREIWAVAAGSAVTEAQMKALFGEGLHPNAEQITRYVTGRGVGAGSAIREAKLGSKFYTYDNANAFIRRLHEAYEAYNTAAGQAPDTTVDPETKEHIRTLVGREMFTAEYERAPDERELTGFIARNLRGPDAVAGFDLTFTMTKGESALWAISAAPVRKVVEECLHQAAAETITLAEKEAAFTRMGANGVAQYDTSGLIVAAFQHRDSRAGDPHLHLHCAVSSKVCAVGPDGLPHWLALDAEPLYKAKVSLSEFFNTRREQIMMERLGVLYEEVAGPPTPGGGGDKRPVRDIAAPDDMKDDWAKLLARWSSRDAAIERRTGELATAFQATHGREPNAVETLRLNQQAWRETRQAKHEPRSLGEQLHAWRTEAIQIRGNQRSLTKLATALSGRLHQREQISAEWIAQQAAQVIATVSEKRSQWQVNHVRAEAQRILRYTGHRAGQEVIEAIVAAALRDHSIVLTLDDDSEKDEPAALRRHDGTSVFTRHGLTTYSSAPIIAAERRILAAANLRDGRVVDDTSVSLALLEYHANNGFALNDGQTAMVKLMATSGLRVQAGSAAAGTGKTSAAGVLAAAWRNGGGTVIGLAPTAGAAEVLAEKTGIHADTLAKFIQLAFPERCPVGPAKPDDPAWKWFDAIGPDTLIIVDEAAQASTFAADAVRAVTLARGASTRWLGDDQQLPSISASGIFTDLAELPDTVQLSAVVRFAHPAEAGASLAIRSGDPAGIAFYTDNSRVHIGHDVTAKDMAYSAWAADLVAGRDSIMVAPTNEITRQLNERAHVHVERLTQTGGATVSLGDGLTASVGDWVTTRKNARWLRDTRRGKWVKNGHRWVIRAINSDGSIEVSPLRNRGAGWVVTLPPDYLRAHTTMGYASTINAVQGYTAGYNDVEGTCHLVGSDQLSCQQFYTGNSRATHENHTYFSTSEADPHRIVFDKATNPPTAVEVMERLLRHDGRQVSAHSVVKHDRDPAARLHNANEYYLNALSAGAATLAGAAVMARIDDAAANVDGICFTDCAAWPVLRDRLAVLAIEGRDPVDELSAAVRSRPLGDAKDKAAVVEYRLSYGALASRATGPLPWLPVVPKPLEDHQTWGPYLTKRAAVIMDLIDTIRVAAHGWDATTAPAWARPLLPNPDLLADIAVFRAAHNIDAADTRVTGPKQFRVRSQLVQRDLHQHVDAELTYQHPGIKRWATLARDLDKHIVKDPFWPRLAVEIDALHNAGADVRAVLRAAIAQGPLPDEQPAAALHWRITGSLADTSLHAADLLLRPDWTPHLHRLFDSDTAEMIVTDPTWPTLVTEVRLSGWVPADLLSVAAEHLYAIAETEGLRSDQYAQLLTYRVQLIANHLDLDRDVPHPAEHVDPPVIVITEDDIAADEVDIAHDHPAAVRGLQPPRDPAFEDLSTQRPIPEDLDIPTLRAAHDAAETRAAQLADAILQGGGGPAERAAGPELAALHRRHQAQRPYLRDLAEAHSEWVRAEDHAELHGMRLDNLAAGIAAALESGDTAAAEDCQQQRDELVAKAERIATKLTTSRAALDIARASLLEAAGGADNVVTEHRIQQRRTLALTADTDALNQARNEARDLANRLIRAEMRAARAQVQGEHCAAVRQQEIARQEWLDLADEQEQARDYGMEL
jgi:TrwC relaxase/AAA domain